jgi:hypothetical protein
MANPEGRVLTQQDAERILALPDGTNIVLTLARDGRLSTAAAIEAISKQQETARSRFRRFVLALTDALVR